MPKRFTETTKWSDPWFRGLSPKLKAFWLYCLDNCDHAGVWPVDFGLASFCIGEQVTQKEIAGAFAGRVIFFNIDKMLVLKFIRFQYGVLSPDCKMHKPVYASLTKNGLNYDNLKGIDTLSIGFETLQVKEKDKDKEKDQEKTRARENSDFKAHPWFSDAQFLKEWSAWSKERRTAGTERNFATLRGLACDDLALATRIVAASADNGWKGLFPLKDGRPAGKSNSRQKNTEREYEENLTL